MTHSKVWRRILGVQDTVVEKIERVEETDKVVAHVRPVGGHAKRCSECNRKCPGYDQAN